VNLEQYLCHFGKIIKLQIPVRSKSVFLKLFRVCNSHKVMNKANDQNYLANQQYKDGANLNARIALHQRFSTNKYDWQRWVFDQLDLPETARILECGGGPGWFWRKNTDRIPPNWEITLSDFSAGMLEEAQQNLKNGAANFSFRQVDIQNIPFEQAYFDAVIANHMLYHVPDRSKAFAEVKRVLKPDGRFYAATNGQKHLQELDQFGTEEFDLGISRFSLNFTLDEGTEQLAPFFTKINRRLYEDSLVVTEVEPLIAYMLSTYHQPTPEQVANARAKIARIIAEKGAFNITKDTGIFIAQNQP
jgi:ubiquinone/menaquinone biosynthesis C-methylase UbiE